MVSLWMEHGTLEECIRDRLMYTSNERRIRLVSIISVIASRRSHPVAPGHRVWATILTFPAYCPW
jgi:hypothetical protein